MAIQQISVFIENRPGQMANIVKLIADSGINLRAMSIAESAEFGILRLIVSDTEKAKEMLSKEALVKVNDVVAVRMPDAQGALYTILTVLDKAQVNVEYSYAFTAPKNGGAYVVFRVDDAAAAESILADKVFLMMYAAAL